MFYKIDLTKLEDTYTKMYYLKYAIIIVNVAKKKIVCYWLNIF